MHRDLNQRITVHGKINFMTASASMFANFYKVVKTLSEASKLRQGDILVTEMTMPAMDAVVLDGERGCCGYGRCIEPLRNRES